MPRTYADYMNEVKRHEVCRGIAPNELDALTWRGIVDIAAENDLAFLIGEGRINTEASYSTGTVAVTNGGTSLTFTDATLVTTWTNRRIRIEGRTEPYDVATIPTTATATLSQAFQGDTDSGLAFEIYRDVYPMPTDCEFSKELLLWDVTNGRRIEFVDYPEFREKKRASLAATGEPTEAARIGLTAAGVPQIELGPLAPSAARTILIDYYKSPVKPATTATSLSPLWPIAFENAIWERVIWKYAETRGHPRRLEAEQKYKRTIFNLNAKFDGGNEMRRRLRASASMRGGSFVVGARWTGT